MAVKMLENSTGEGDEFINEVATIGLIHHANFVRLLGFCSQGTRRALIYEFMPNESLEKYIFLHASGASQQLLVPNKRIAKSASSTLTSSLTTSCCTTSSTQRSQTSALQNFVRGIKALLP